MLLLAIELKLRANRRSKPLPDFLGGALHGLFERAITEFAPGLEPYLRPHGADGLASFTLLSPPFGASPTEKNSLVAFGICLFGPAESAWSQVLSAITHQSERGLHGWQVNLKRARLERPGGMPIEVWNDDLPDEFNPIELPKSIASEPLAQWPVRSRGLVHALSFQSPLLLASHAAQRRRLQDSDEPHPLPWPTLGSILESLSKRARALEPSLADSLGIDLGWTAPPHTYGANPSIWATDPAKQVRWLYTSVPKPRGSDDPSGPTRRALNVRGIVGTLIYCCELPPAESTLLDLGQWLGVGQKTTMGCGNYTLVNVVGQAGIGEVMPEETVNE